MVGMEELGGSKVWLVWPELEGWACTVLLAPLAPRLHF
jgi:hypothetical protein